MSRSDESSSTVLLNTVEKAELMSAVGREIERIDRQSASSGYTSWALWAAIGVLGWKVIELISLGASSEVGLIYLLLIISIATANFPVRFFFQMPDSTYFRFSDSIGKAGLARLLLLASITGICIAIQVFRAPPWRVDFWLPTAFVSLPMLGFARYLVRKIPVADGMPAKGPGRSTFWLVFALVFAMGVASISVLLPFVDMAHVRSPNVNVKVAVLLVVTTILVLQLSANLRVGERRTQFQRLETELTLSKIEVSEAKERYENLMLGMNVSLAIRPLVDAVMLPLEEANACVSEVKQLLVRFQQARESTGGDQDNSPLDIAVKERVESLLGSAKRQFFASGKAYSKLKSVSYVMFGERDISQSPISAESERIHAARRRLEATFSEIEALEITGT